MDRGTTFLAYFPRFDPSKLDQCTGAFGKARPDRKQEASSGFQSGMPRLHAPVCREDQLSEALMIGESAGRHTPSGKAILATDTGRPWSNALTYVGSD